MRLQHTRTLITGATGGIGQHLALELAKEGAKLVLAGRRLEVLQSLQQQIIDQGHIAPTIISTDLTTTEGRQHLMEQIRHSVGGIDMLINNAGVVEFNEFHAQEPAMIEQIIRTNLTAPMQLTHDLLPGMLDQHAGTIVNIGSIFGSIGFGYFSAYSTSKFALRGFSESLRRELDGTGVRVLYIAPRATKTDANSPAVYEMAKATKMHMDEPEVVAKAILKAILNGKPYAYLGFPESLFVRINSLLPNLVDIALRKQTRIMSRFASKA
jgi:short-subunit dehydrogenase